MVFYILCNFVFAHAVTSDALNLRILMAEACVVSSVFKNSDRQVLRDSLHDQVVHWQDEISLIHSPDTKATMSEALKQLTQAVNNDQTDLQYEVFEFVKCAANLLLDLGKIRTNFSDRFKQFNHRRDSPLQRQITFESDIPEDYLAFDSSIRGTIKKTMDALFAQVPELALSAHFIIRVDKLTNLKTRIKAALKTEIQITRDDFITHVSEIRTVHIQNLEYVYVAEGLDTLVFNLERQFPYAVQFFNRQPRSKILSDFEKCYQLLTDVMTHI